MLKGHIQDGGGSEIGVGEGNNTIKSGVDNYQIQVIWYILWYILVYFPKIGIFFKIYPEYTEYHDSSLGYKIRPYPVLDIPNTGYTFWIYLKIYQIFMQNIYPKNGYIFKMLYPSIFAISDDT